MNTMVIGNGIINIVANTERFTSSITNLTRNLPTANVGRELGKRIAQGISKGLMAGGVAVAGAMTAIIKPALSDAMEAVESENLFEVSMGKRVAEARKWSEELNKSLGLNDYEVRKNSAMLYTMFNSMKLNEQAAFDMSKNMTTLAYDMASFYNLKPEEAFEKLRAGITGEAEPLKSLGILIDENTIKTYAYSKGIAKQGAQLTEQQKVMARYAAIIDQTMTASGDLARTMDSPTNQIRIMKDELRKMSIDFGMTLMPILKDFMETILKPLMTRLKEFMAWWKGIPEESRQRIIKLIFTVSALSVAIGSVVSIGMKIFELVKGFKMVFSALKLVPLLTNPVGLAIAGIGLAAFLVIKYWTPISNFFKKVWGGVKNVTKSHIPEILAVVMPFIGLPLLIIKHWDKIKGGVSRAFTGLKSTVKNGIQTISQDFAKADWGERIVYILNPITYILEKKFGLITKLKTAFKEFGDKVSEVTQKIGSPLDWLKKLIEALAQKWANFKNNFSLPEIKMPSIFGGSNSKNAENTTGSTKNTNITVNTTNNVSNGYDANKANNSLLQGIKRFAFGI